MQRRFILFIFSVLLVPVLTLSTISCGGNDTEKKVQESESGQLVTAFAQAKTDESMEAAIEKVVTSSLSIGLLDEEGNQLNPNVGPDAVSLSQIAVASYTQMGVDGSFRTIEYVVDFLADAGIILESTGETITLEDFLPDLQSYVERSYAHPDDPESTLGIMIASGTSMTVPDKVPVLSGSTEILPLTSLLITADILLGTGNGEIQEAVNPFNLFGKKAVAAPSEEALQQIRGLITKIKSYSILTDLLPARAQQLLAAFESCDRLSVRMWEVPESMIPLKKWDHSVTGSLLVARSFTLEKRKRETVTILGGVAVMNGLGSVPETIEGVDIDYRFQLVSSDEQGTGVPLYNDADAVLAAFSGAGNTAAYSSDLNGHRLRVASTNTVPFMLNLSTIKSEVPRRALLHASALITAPENLYDLATQKLREKLGGGLPLGLATLALDQMPWEEIKQTMELMNREFQPTPWMCMVDFTPVEAESEPEEEQIEESEPGPPAISITSPSTGSTVTENGDILITIEAYDDQGEPISERYIYQHVKWLIDGELAIIGHVSENQYRVNSKMERGEHTITASIAYNGLTDEDTVTITVVPEEFTLLEILLKKEWSLYMNDNMAASWVKFYGDGTFFFKNDGWQTSWVLSGSAITLEMIWDYPNSGLQHVRLTGSLVEADDLYYSHATMSGEYEEWCDWDRDGTYKTGTWRAD